MRAALDRGRLTAALIALLATLAVAVPAPAAAQRERAAPALDAASWILIDPRDDAVLASEGADERRPMGSTAKLMTAIVARRALELSDEIVAPRYDGLPAESLMGLEPGERISADDLFHGLLMVSGNDAAQTLAIASSGSVPAFVEQMNATAADLGLSDTSYENPIGLDGEAQFTTAADLAELAEVAVSDPYLRRIVGTRRETLRGGEVTRRLVNSNTLLQSTPWVTGIKTGYTSGAGYVLASSGERRGIRLIAVVMGAPSEPARDAASRELLDYGFSRYAQRTPIREGDRLASATLELQDGSVELRSVDAVSLTAREDQRVEVLVDAPSTVRGPIERGMRLGTATVELDGEVVDRVALSAASAVPAPSLLERADGVLIGPRALVWIAIALVVALAVGLAGLAARALRGGS